ncbi:uncharacterized protein LOC134188769 isoform X2 [Corticium candelabrum]|uniref:uncharacterized protein LOC134188769 isoform X2 n=1 Tax=Corticium candelabrum TaxID=121492 RepID=UPI002E2716CC|nr:uncharacterized protein LOC134188769 isoform X2 [Corticium candelabrum]
MSSCFLCSTPLDTTTLWTKRKRLDGRSLTDARHTLEVMLQEHSGLPLSSYLPPAGPAYVCHYCQKDLKKLSELHLLKVKIKQQLAHLPVYVCGTASKRQRLEVPGDKDGDEMTGSQPEMLQQRIQKVSPKVVVKYKSGMRAYNLASPRRKQAVKRCVRGNLFSVNFATTSAEACNTAITSLKKKTAKEINQIRKLGKRSVFMDSEALLHFSWDRIWLELKNYTPTLLHVISILVSESAERCKPLVCFIASTALKQRYQQFSIVQRVISLLLYGNGTAKQVFSCLQPLMVCISHKGTLKILDRISDNFDSEVKSCSENLKHHFPTEMRIIGVAKSSELAQSPLSSNQSEYRLDTDNQTDHCTENQTVDKTVSTDSELKTEILESDGHSSRKSTSDLDSPSSQLSDIDVENCLLEDDTGREVIQCQWTGFKIVGDNIDKNVRPSNQRVDHQTRSYHYFHSFALLDRIDLSISSNRAPNTFNLTIDDFLINSHDIMQLERDFEVLLSRVLVRRIPDFEHQAADVVWHIPCKYQKEMSSKSKMVPLEVLLHNEIYLPEMCKILGSLQEYVPSRVVNSTLDVGDKSLCLKNVDFLPILMGGDQLTAARARGAKSLRSSHDNAKGRLEGLLPVVEDWHARLTLAKAIWKRLYWDDSSRDKGTLHHLKHVLNKTSVHKDPGKDLKAAEDFFTLAWEAHVVSAAQSVKSTQGKKRP